MTKGLDECLARLTQMEAKAPRKAREAVTEVAKEFKSELESNTPVYPHFTDHLKEDVRISNFKSRGDAPAKDIGYGVATGWRSHFPDDGTIYQRAQNFKEKTINAVTPRAKEIYANKVREVLD